MKKATKSETITTAADYLKKPYGRIVLPDSDGTFFAEIIEFSGCFATGETSEEALRSLERVAIGWIESTLARNQRVPDPIDASEFSGKLMLRLPKSLHKKATHHAARDSVSLNQFIVACIAEAVGDRSRSTALIPIHLQSYSTFNVVTGACVVNQNTIGALSGHTQLSAPQQSFISTHIISLPASQSETALK